MIIQVAILLALMAFLFIFISIDNLNKRNQMKKSLEHEKSWIDYERTLPKYVP